MGRLAVVCLLLGGCNQLYGLDKTLLIDAGAIASDDKDGDGVADATDNCPDVPNSGQENVDGDSLGDVCDPCSFRFDPALDRDTDSVAAGMDRCPGIYDANQTDSDNDGVGDACDPDPASADTLRCFADFWVGVADAWSLGGVWTFLGTQSSAVIIKTGVEAPFWLHAKASGLAPSQIAVQVGLQPPAKPTQQVTALTGVAISAPDESSSVACEFERYDNSLRLRLADSRGALQETVLSISGQKMYITLAYRKGAAGTELVCAASVETGQRELITATTDAPFSPDMISLTAANTTQVFFNLSVYNTP